MNYLVTYDISDEKRLRQVARVCEDFGHRLQKSVFICELDDSRFSDMWRRLSIEADPEKDAVRAWPLCAACKERAIMIGAPEGYDRDEAVVVF